MTTAGTQIRCIKWQMDDWQSGALLCPLSQEGESSRWQKWHLAGKKKVGPVLSVENFQRSTWEGRGKGSRGGAPRLLTPSRENIGYLRRVQSSSSGPLKQAVGEGNGSRRDLRQGGWIRSQGRPRGGGATRGETLPDHRRIVVG